MNCDAVVGLASYRTGYWAIRSLSRLGLRVAAVDSSRFGMGQVSRYSSAHYVHADYQTHPEQFMTDMVNILTECGAHFYLPGHDEGEIVAKYRDRLPPDVIVPLPDHDKLVMTNDKMKISRYARDLGVILPQIVSWQTLDELKDAVERLGRPVVIKLRRGSGAKGVFYASTPDEAVKVANDVITRYDLSPDRFPLVQERVDGEGWGVSCLYWEGKRVAFFTHRRLREKIATGGTSTLRCSQHNPIMEEQAFRILDGLNWHGLAMVEFKWDPAQKQCWFIEINPRLWGSIALPVGCGVDFPAMTYVAAVKGIRPAMDMFDDYQDDIVARWYLGDAILALSHLAKGRIPTAMRLLMPGRTDLYDDLLKDDIRATLAEFAYYVLRFSKQGSINPRDRGMLG